MSFIDKIFVRMVSCIPTTTLWGWCHHHPLYRLRKVKQFPQGCTAFERQTWDSLWACPSGLRQGLTSILFVPGDTYALKTTGLLISQSPQSTAGWVWPHGIKGNHQHTEFWCHERGRGSE